MHCYCIQVNSSDYGDSRIVAPKSSTEKDIVKTKGGLNPCVLISDIDIKSLRDFQRMDYTLQKQDGRFKPSPPKMFNDPALIKRHQN